MINTRRLVRDPATWITALVVVVTVIASLLVRTAVINEQETIHSHQASKVVTILESLVASIDDVMTVLGDVYQPGQQAGGEAFVSAADGRLEGVTVAVFAATLRDADVVVVSAVGDGPSTGSVLDSDLARLVRRAVDSDALVTDIVDGDAPGLKRWALAKATSDGLVVVQVNIIQPETPIQVEPDSAFADLDLMVYTSSPETDNTLLLTATPEPLGDDALRTEFTAGDETWLLVSKPNGALVGRFAASVWLIVLAGGLVSAVAVGTIIALTVRRRQYAQALVEQRTSELRAAMQQLAEAKDIADAANTSKNEFLSRMSHELRTPLNGVLGFAQILELGDLTDDQTDSVRQILKAGNHLLALINEVLDISRIEAGNISVSLEPVLLSELVDETIDLQRPTASEASVTFEVAMHCSCDHYVVADRQRLKQIILNLASNAIKYNRTGGTVTFSCECDGNRVHLRVSDTGRGIADDKQPLLFLPFERLGAEHTSIEGTGIGLALSRKLAHALGGTLQLEHSGNDGSTFVLTLDNAEGQSERYQRLNNHTGRTTTNHTTGASILYVEDNLANIKLVEKILQQRPDIALTPVMQGRLALELAQTQQPSLILLDLHLPDINGDDVLDTLRTNPTTTHIPVVMISADATPGQIRRLINAGATDYITKPINVDTLLEIIDRTTTTTAQRTQA